MSVAHVSFAAASFANATRNNKISDQMSETSRIRTKSLTVTTAERSPSAIVTFLDEMWSIYKLKLEIAHSWPGNLSAYNSRTSH